MSETNTRKANILVVDDEPDNLRLLAQVLARQGHTVRPASNGALALSSAQAEPPDLILLDLLMPGMNGYAVCERLKADERTQNVPVIVVSARGEAVDKVRAFSLGAVDYITRPFQSEEIVARVETHLAVRNLQRRLEERNAQLEREIAKRAQAEGQIRQYADEQAALYTIASAATTSLDPDELLATLLKVVLSATQADAAWVLLPGPTPDDLPQAVAWRGVPQVFVEAEESAPLHTCPICQPLLAGEGMSHELIPMTDCPVVSDELLASLDLCEHVAIPLSAQDRVLGILKIAWCRPHTYTDADRSLLSAIGQQVGLALQNAQLYQDARRVDQLELLNTITTAAVSSLELDAVLRHILELTKYTLGATAGSILLPDQDTEDLFFAVTVADEACDLKGLRISPEQGIAGWAVKTGQVACVNDVHADPRWYAGVDALTGFKTRSLLCAPLKHRGRVSGVIEFINKRRGDFTEDDVSLVEAVASIASGAVVSTRLYTAVRARANELAMLNALGLALTSTLDPYAVARVALSLIQRFFRADGVALLQIDPQTHELRPAQALIGGTPVEIPMHLQPDKDILEQMLNQRQPSLIKDSQSDPGWLGHANRYAEQQLGKPVRSAMAAPLSTPQDVLGVLLVGSTEPGAYTHQEMTTLLSIASTLAVALENARLYQAERTAREQLRDLTAYLQTAREEERTHIAREIHDELGQTLTALKFDLSWLIKRLPEDQPDLEKRAQVMSGLIDDTIHTVRRVATELRPGLLDDLGLAAAIEWQAQEFTARTDIDCDLQLDDASTSLDRDLATAVFRIFQETLTNIARHAEATEVRVTLADGPGELTLTVQDNGKGITESQVSDSKSLGLIGMRERARAWGGDITFEGVPNRGTTVTVRIPRTTKKEGEK
ncbi:MAG: GAF domain-containing protein [Anaerolineae bacterium]|jgi:signal transduction histidine kinase/DNA-binding response OmpR family regulator